MEAIARESATVTLEDAVDGYLEFIHVPRLDIPYEVRQEMRRELLKTLILARAARRRGES